ncbi:MAG: glycine cleavage system protein GcvH [Candidatus Asgardarchaeia archaeon]
MVKEYKIPEDRKYTETHEWAKKEGNIVTVGISEFAVDALGGITQIELSIENPENPKVRDPLEEGITVKKGASIAVIDTAKSTEDVYSPVSGKVVEVNKDIEDDPEVVETSPYDDGWFVKIEISDESEYEQLMDATKYSEHVKKSAEELGLE